MYVCIYVCILSPLHTFWKHRPSGPMLSISRNVRPSVCLSVRLFVRVFTFEVPFKRLFAPTSWSRMSNIFRDSECLGKSNGKKWSQIWFFFKWSEIAKQKNEIFFWLILPYKTRWKPGFPMNKRPLVTGCIANFGIFLEVFEFLSFGWFIQFFKQFGFLGILDPPGNHAFRWIRDLWSKGISLILAYF